MDAIFPIMKHGGQWLIDRGYAISASAGIPGRPSMDGTPSPEKRGRGRPKGVKNSRPYPKGVKRPRKRNDPI